MTGPQQPDPEELARVRHELANALLIMAEQTAPILDAADGMRADLEKRGWSPTAAEKVALTWLMGAMGSIAGGV